MTPFHRRRSPIATALCTLACLLIGTAQAETPDDAALNLARTYFHDLDNQRFDAARAVMSDALQFEDPTYNVALDDPNAVIEAYGNTSGFSNVIIKERMAFANSGTAVIHYIVSLDLAPPEGSDLEEPVPVLADLVRVATIEDGKVTRHFDLAAYGEIDKAIQRAKEANNAD